MIRALVGFVLTIALVVAAGLWAVGVVHPVERLQAPPPVSRTVELLAADLAERLPPLPSLRASEGAEAERSLDASAPNAVAGAEVATLRTRDEVVEEAPRGALRPHPLPRDPVDEDRDDAIADAAAGGDALAETPIGDDDAAQTDPYARHEALADSATLVRRMLGLYQRALDPE